jgi:predicted house-cleaning noncanonical NTP pyrophosphatase (MazG superfamily)
MKLVRDRIPELAGASQPVVFHQATEAEFARLLPDKLQEEAAEAATATPAELLEELGDVLQVLYALASQAGYSPAEIECARARKARTHGTYTRRILWQPATGPAAPRPMEAPMGLYSDNHLLVGGQPDLEVHAWQHPSTPGRFTVEVNTADRHGRIALTGTPSDLHGLLAHLAEALLAAALAAGCQGLPAPTLTTPHQPGGALVAAITIHIGTRERLEPAISKATPLGALGTEALVWIGATSIRGSAAALRALADALVEAADLADDYDADPDAFTEREQAGRDLDQ